MPSQSHDEGSGGVVDEDKWARVAAVSGVLFVVLLVVSGFLPGTPPKLSDSPAKIFRYFTDHQSSVQLATFLGGLAVIPGLVWGSALWRRLRAAETDGRSAVIAITGLVVAGAVAISAGAINATSAVRIHDLGPSGAKFFLTLSTFMGAGTAFGLAVLVGGTAVAALRSHAFPTWFGVVSAALTVVWIVAGLAGAYAGDGVQAIGFIAFLIWAVWVLVTVWLLWSPAAQASSTSS